jgi:anti-anti-sigma factor
MLTIRTQIHRRTALVEVSGELDMFTRPQVADALDRLKSEQDELRHIILDLRGLTFMDGQGLHELIRQLGFAHERRHNFAVIRGPQSVHRLLEMTAAEELLVIVDDPDDLAPPSLAEPTTQ